MKARTKQLLKALLDHQKAIFDPAADERRVKKYTLTYGDLCLRAGLPGQHRQIGPDLLDIGQWCEEHGYPPLNVLVVNQSTGLPGEGIRYAPDGGRDWARNVAACARFTGDPVLP